MIDLMRNDVVPIRAGDDLVRVRRVVRDWSAQLGFHAVNQTKFMTAASELARNALVHGGGGVMRIELVEGGFAQGLRLTFEDHGPGIPDVELALTDGYTTADGLGLGLGGAKRLAHEFEISSTPGEGTTVSITMWA